MGRPYWSDIDKEVDEYNKGKQPLKSYKTHKYYYKEYALVSIASSLEKIVELLEKREAK